MRLAAAGAVLALLAPACSGSGSSSPGSAYEAEAPAFARKELETTKSTCRLKLEAVDGDIRELAESWGVAPEGSRPDLLRAVAKEFYPVYIQMVQGESFDTPPDVVAACEEGFREAERRR